MGDVSILTQAGRLFRWRTTNATDSSLPSKVATGTKPAVSFGTAAAQATSAAVRELTHPGVGGRVQNTLLLTFYGAGSDDNTFVARAIKWNVVDEGGVDTALWVPIPLFEATVTLSTAVGVSGRLVTNTDRFADTIVLTANSANANVDVSVRSPAANYPAVLKVDMEGPMLLEMIFSTGSSATSCNALGQMF